MDIVKQTKRRIEQKINGNLQALLLNKIIQTSKWSATTTGMKGQLHFGSREKRAIPVMAILQAGAAIGATLIKGINALVDAKGAKSFNNALKMVRSKCRTNTPATKNSRKQNINDSKSNNASIR